MSEPTIGERLVRIEVQTQTLTDSFNDFKIAEKEARQEIRAEAKTTNAAIQELRDTNKKTYDRLTLVGAIVMAVVFIIQFMPKLGEFLAVLAAAK
jgi:hypothetical protein